jgi:hypothetical protein
MWRAWGNSEIIMMTNLVFAEAAATGIPALATWFMVILSVVSGVGGMLAVASYFATRREVDDIKSRLAKVEDVTSAIQERMGKQKDEIMYSAERRSAVLHNRINPVVENLAALKASSEAFVTVFEGFTEMMQGRVCPMDDPKVESRK